MTEPISAKDAIMSQEKEPKTPAPFTARAMSSGPQRLAPTKAHLPASLDSARSDNNSTTSSKPPLDHTAAADGAGSNISHLKPVLQRVPESWMQEHQQQQLLSTGRHVQAPPPSPRAPVATSPRAVGLPNTVQARSAVAIQRFAAALDAAGLADPVVRALAVNYTARTCSSSIQEDDFSDHRPAASTPDYPAVGSNGGVSAGQITSSLLMTAGSATTAAALRGSGTLGSSAGVATSTSGAAAAAAGHYRGQTVSAGGFVKPVGQYRMGSNSAYMGNSSNMPYAAPLGHPVAVAAAAARDPSSSVTAPSTPATPATAAVAVHRFAASASKAGLAHAEFMAIAATASSAVEGANPADSSSSSAVKAGMKGPLYSMLFTGSSAASSMIKANNSTQEMGYSAAGTVAPLLRTSDYGTYNNDGRKYGGSGDGSVGVYGRRLPSTRSESCDGSISTKLAAKAETVSSAHAGSTWGRYNWRPAVSPRAAAAGGEGLPNVSPAPALLPAALSVHGIADGHGSTGSVSGTTVQGADRSATGSVARLHLDSCDTGTTGSSGGRDSSISSSRNRHGSDHAEAVALGVRSARSISSSTTGSRISNISTGAAFGSSSTTSSSSLRQLNIERAMLPECTQSNEMDSQHQTQEEIQPEQDDSLEMETTAEPDALGEPQFWLSPIVASAARTSGGSSHLPSNQSCQSLQGSIGGDQTALHGAFRCRKTSTLQSAEWASAMSYLASDTSSAAAADILPALEQMQPGAGDCDRQQQQQMEQRSTAGAAVAAAGAAAAAAIGSLRSMIGRQPGAGVPAAEAASLPINSPRDATEESVHTDATAAVESGDNQHQQQQSGSVLQQPEAALRQRITHSAAGPNAAGMHWVPVSSDVPGSPVFSASEYASTLDQTGGCESADGSEQEVTNDVGWNINRMFLCGSAPSSCASKVAVDAAAKQHTASQTGSSKPCSKAVVVLLTLLVLLSTAGLGVGIYFGVRNQSKAVQAAAASSSHAAGTRAVSAGGVVGVTIAEGERDISNTAYGVPVGEATTTAAGTAAGAAAAGDPSVIAAAVRPMNFQVVLAVPALSAPEACAAWFNGTDRLLLYKQIFAAAYTNALHVPVLESSINSITCDSSNVYSSSKAAAAPGAAAAAGAAAEMHQNNAISTAAAAPNTTSALLPADSSLQLNNTPAAAAGGMAVRVGTAGMRLARPSADLTVHQTPNQTVQQEVNQATLLSNDATVQRAGSGEIHTGKADHQQLNNHTVQLPAPNHSAPQLADNAAQQLQQLDMLSQQLAAENTTQLIAEDRVLTTTQDSTEVPGNSTTAATVAAAATATNTNSSFATLDTNGAADADHTAREVPASAPESETNGSSVALVAGASMASGNTTAAVAARPTADGVKASFAVPLFLATAAAADHSTMTPTTAFNGTDADLTAHLRSLLQQPADSSLTLVEVVTRFSVAAPATTEQRAHIVETVITASSAILREPLSDFFRGPPAMPGASNSSRQASEDHEIATEDLPQQQLPSQKWIVPTVSYDNAPTCLFNLTKENSLQDEEGRLWSIMDGKQCIFRPNADIPRPEVKTHAWTTAPLCTGQATEVTSVADDSGRLWGWQNGSSCAFRQTKQQGAQSSSAATAAATASQAAAQTARPVKLNLVWDAAPPCSFAPTKSNAVPDTYGRLWSWENDRSCAFKWQSLPDSLQLET